MGTHTFGKDYNALKITVGLGMFRSEVKKPVSGASERDTTLGGVVGLSFFRHFELRRYIVGDGPAGVDLDDTVFVARWLLPL